jgi:hypothetical protein
MTCDQATFMLERRWDKTLDGDEERNLDGHIRGCETCRAEADAIVLADAAFMRIPECAPPLNIAAAVARRIAEESPAETKRAWFWGAVMAIAAAAAAVWEFGIPVPAALLSGPYVASIHSALATLAGAAGYWLRPAMTVIRSLTPAAPTLIPFFAVMVTLEMMLVARWMARGTGHRHSGGRI